jgi:hypothetical protein
MKMKFFDFEIYPDWWCVAISDEEPEYASSAYKFKFTPEEEKKIKDKMRVYTSDGGVDSYKQVIQDLSTGCLSGYNIKRFDMIIVKCVSMHFTPRQIYIASQILVNNTNFGDLNITSAEVNRISAYVRGWSAKWQGAQAFQDLMDDSDKGLKDKEASFGMDIRETDVPFGKTNLTEEEKTNIIYYCKHDVYALHVQYVCVAKPYVDTKLSLGYTYDIPEKVCYESTNAVLAGKVLGAERVSGTTIKDPTIYIYETPIREYIEKWVPKEALNHLLTSQKPKQMTMFENKVFMADGGIHSVFTTPKVGKEQGKLYVEACDEWGLYNIDLSGCHPSVMLFCGAMPRGIKKPERFKESVFRRRRLKTIPKSEWTEDDVKFVPAGKLIHNTTYGAAGNKYLPLYDDYMRSKVCRVSQAIIIAVSMAIYTQLPGTKIIQTNTDGILLYTRRENKEKLQAIIKEFEDLSEFAFELEEDSKIWQLNVNNYIALNAEGKDKLKGKSFVTSIWQPGYNKVRPLSNHIIAKCQYQFYVNKKDPIRMLLEHDHVNDFILTCTKGSTYSAMVQKTRDGDIKLGKVARVIATTTEKYGEVRKQKMENGKLAEDLCANCPPHTWIMNDALYNYHIEGPFTDRRIVHNSGMSAKIDMAYYARLLDKALDIPWYKLKHGKLTFTHEFNLQGG